MMKNKAIEELIKKREDMLGGIGPIGSSWDYIEDFIADLKTLQSERDEVEISYKDTRTTTSDLELSRCKCGAAVGTLDTYCFSCGKKIKRIE